MELKDKNVIITGGNSGIGYYTAFDLAKRDAVVTILGRDEKTCQSSVETIKTESQNQNVFYKIVDLSSFSSIKQFAEHYISDNTRLDVLVNNAGIVSPTTPATEQGVETTIGINYLGHFYLVHLLKDLLLSAAGRVVVVASDAYKFGRGKITTELLQGDSPEFFKPVDSAGIKEYGASNVARVMFAQEFVKRYPTVKCVSLHPGLVSTNIGRNHSKLFTAIVGFIWYPFSKNPDVGAKTSIHCAIEEIGDEENGGYFVDCWIM